MASLGGFGAVDGNAALSGGSTEPGRDFIDTVNSITADGDIGSFDIYMGAALSGGESIKLKVWRENGVNYDFIGESQEITELSAGLNSGVTLTTPISVLTGDYIGVHVDTGASVDVTTGSGTIRFKTTDDATNQAISTYNTNGSNLSVEVFEAVATTLTLRKGSPLDSVTHGLGTITTATLNSVNVFDHVTGQTGTTVSFAGAATDEITTSGQYTLTLGDGATTESITVQVNVYGPYILTDHGDADANSILANANFASTGTVQLKVIDDFDPTKVVFNWQAFSDNQLWRSDVDTLDEVTSNATSDTTDTATIGWQTPDGTNGQFTATVNITAADPVPQGTLIVQDVSVGRVSATANVAYSGTDFTRVQYSLDGQNWTNFTPPLLVVDGLERETGYTVTVRVINEAGTGPTENFSLTTKATGTIDSPVLPEEGAKYSSQRFSRQTGGGLTGLRSWKIRK